MRKASKDESTSFSPRLFVGSERCLQGQRVRCLDLPGFTNGPETSAEERMPTPKPVCPRPRRGALGTGLAYRRGRADGTQLGIWKGDRPIPPRGTLHAATGVLARERDGRDAEEETQRRRRRRRGAGSGGRTRQGDPAPPLGGCGSEDTLIPNVHAPELRGKTFPRV